MDPTRVSTGGTRTTSAFSAMRRLGRAIGGAVLVSSISLAGCTLLRPSQAPMTTSLRDLVSETNTVRGALLSHSQLTNLTGLSPVGIAGAINYYPDSLWGQAVPHDMAVGISRRGSFELVGTVRGPDHDVAAQVADALAQVLARASAVLQRTAEVAQARQRAAEQSRKTKADDSAAREDMRRLTAEASKVARALGGSASEAFEEARKQGEALGIVDPPALTPDGGQGQNGQGQPAAPTPALQAAVPGSTALDDALQALRQAEIDLTASEEALRHLVHRHPGVIIARWRASDAATTSWNVSSFTSGSASSDLGREGLVVLSGLRVRKVHFGMDFIGMYLRATPMLRSLFDSAAFTSFSLQAEQVRYVSTLELQSQIQLAADLRVRDAINDPAGLLEAIDQLRIETVRQTLASLGNLGTIGGIDWHYSPLDFHHPSFEERNLRLATGDPIEVESYRQSEHDARLASISLGENPPPHQTQALADRAANDGAVASTLHDKWHTVTAVITRLTGLTRAFRNVATSERVFTRVALPPLMTCVENPALAQACNERLIRLAAMCDNDGSYLLAESFSIELKGLQRRIEQLRPATEHARRKLGDDEFWQRFGGRLGDACQAIADAIDTLDPFGSPNRYLSSGTLLWCPPTASADGESTLAEVLWRAASQREQRVRIDCEMMPAELSWEPQLLLAFEPAAVAPLATVNLALDRLLEDLRRCR